MDMPLDSVYTGRRVGACLRNYLRSLYTSILAKFFLDSVSVSRYVSFI